MLDLRAQDLQGKSKEVISEIVEIREMEDRRAIDAHFADFLESGVEKTIGELRTPGEAADGGDREKSKMVPMYIGALNRNIADDAMVSFVLQFACIARDRAINAPKTATTTGKNEHGVALCLFSSVFTSKADVETNASFIEFVDDEQLGAKQTEAKATHNYVPCNGPSESKATKALVCFVFDPKHKKNKPLGKGKPPKFHAFFASAAEEAIKRVWKDHKISKVAILGYGMLKQD